MVLMDGYGPLALDIVFLSGHPHLVVSIFLFPVSIAQFIGEFWKNGEAV